MDVFSLRLDLEGFSDELADSIGLYDVLTIRGGASSTTSSGGRGQSCPSASLDHAVQAEAEEEEVAAPATPILIPRGASTSPLSSDAAASSTNLESDMQFTSSSMDPIVDVDLMPLPSKIDTDVDTTSWEAELQMIVEPQVTDKKGSETVDPESGEHNAKKKRYREPEVKNKASGTVANVAELASRLKMLKGGGDADCGKLRTAMVTAAACPPLARAGQASKSTGLTEPGSLALAIPAAKPVQKKRTFAMKLAVRRDTPVMRP